jgi:branched-chain amino acid transport system permease protein
VGWRLFSSRLLEDLLARKKVRGRLNTRHRILKNRWTPLVIGVISVLWPLAFEDYWVRLVGLALIYAMLGLGLNIVTGYAGLLDIGYAAFFGLGAYVFGILASEQFGLHVPFWLLLPGCVLTAALFGMIVGAPAIRMRGDYLALVTLAWGEIAYLLFLNLDRPIDITGGYNGIVNIDRATIFGHAIGEPLALGSYTLRGTVQLYYVTLLFLGLLVVSVHRLGDSRLGRAWAAIREDELAALFSGVDLFRMKLLAFVLGAGVGGLAGAIFTLWQRSVFPENFRLAESILVLLIVVLGRARTSGILMSALVLILLPELFQGLALYRHVIFGVLLVVLMTLRPLGVLRAQQTAPGEPSDSQDPYGDALVDKQRAPESTRIATSSTQEEE